MDSRDKEGGPVTPCHPPSSTPLWDHRPAGETILVHPFLHKPPRVVVKNHVIAVACHSHLLPDQRPPVLGGAVTADPVLDELCLHVNSISNTPSPLQSAGDLVVPIKVAEGPEDGNMVNIDQHTEDVQRFLRALSSGLPADPAQLIGLRVSCSRQQAANTTVTVSMVIPDTTFRLTPLSPVPVVGTSLARSLGGAREDQPSCGFLGIDEDRRLVVLLPGDPSIESLPLVGVWVSQVALPTHPLAWASMMAYVFPDDPAKSRLAFPPKSFLLALYSPLHPFPEFYDCVLTAGLPRLVCQHHMGVHSLSLPRVPMASHQVFSVMLEKTAHKLECHPPRHPAASAMVNSGQPLTCPQPTDKNLVHRPQVPDMSLLSDSSQYEWRQAKANPIPAQKPDSRSVPQISPTARPPEPPASTWAAAPSYTSHPMAPPQWNSTAFDQHGLSQPYPYLPGVPSYMPYANYRNCSYQPLVQPSALPHPTHYATQPAAPISSTLAAHLLQPETNQASYPPRSTAPSHLVDHQPNHYIYQPQEPVQYSSQASNLSPSLRPAPSTTTISQGVQSPPSSLPATTNPNTPSESPQGEDEGKGLPEKYLVANCSSKIPKPIPRSQQPAKPPKKSSLKTVAKPIPPSKKSMVTFQNKPDPRKEKCDSAIQATPTEPTPSPPPEPTPAPTQLYQPPPIPPGTVLLPYYQLELYQKEIEQLREEVRQLRAAATQPKDCLNVGTMTSEVQTVETGVGDDSVAVQEITVGPPVANVACSPSTNEKENQPPNPTESEHNFQKKLKFVVEYLLNQSNSSAGGEEVIQDNQQQHQAKSAAYLGLGDETSIQVRAVLHKYQLEGSCLGTTSGAEVLAEVSTRLRRATQTLKELTLLDHEDDPSYYVLHRNNQ